MVLAVPSELYRLDVLGTRAFRTLSFRVGHLLAFVQVVKTATLNARRVEEQVLCIARADKSESLVRQPFDSAFSHLCVSRSDWLN